MTWLKKAKIVAGPDHNSPALKEPVYWRIRNVKIQPNAANAKAALTNLLWLMGTCNFASNVGLGLE